MNVFCGCENSRCTHGDGTVKGTDACASVIDAPTTMTPDAEHPHMAFIGLVCVPCAQVMGESHPEWISAPYGTFAGMAAGE